MTHRNDVIRYCPDCAEEESSEESSDDEFVAEKKANPKGRGKAKGKGKAAEGDGDGPKKRGRRRKHPLVLEGVAADPNTRGTADHSIFEAYVEAERKKAPTEAAKKRSRTDLLRRSNLLTGALPLPPSSFDLPVQDTVLALRIAQAYEMIRRFGRILHVKAFLLEDFARALTLFEQTPLLSAVHVALLRTISAELEVGDTMIDSLCWGLLDNHTWPELLRKFLLRYATDESDAGALSTAIFLQDSEYKELTMLQKLEAMELLISHVCGTQLVRDDLGGVPDFESDDFCKQCKTGGDLLCCETCPTVYHIGCTNPPLSELPEDDWFCPECENNRTPGASNAELQDDGSFGQRLYHLGSDRLFRQCVLTTLPRFVLLLVDSREDTLMGGGSAPASPIPRTYTGRTKHPPISDPLSLPRVA